VVVVVLLRRQAFYLYDTLGFPVDLTQLMAVEKGLGVDMQGFAREMEAQKQRSCCRSAFFWGSGVVGLG
jgi:alanyl-tRNA synthetase